MNNHDNLKDGPFDEAEQPTYVRSGELAKVLGVHPATIRRWAVRGIIPRVEPLPGSHLYPLEECLSIIEANRREPSA